MTRLPPIDVPGQFNVGDIVTRDGTDRQRITYVQPDRHSMEVVCIKAPASGWCQIGDSEFNLCRRYAFVENADAAQRARDWDNAMGTAK